MWKSQYTVWKSSKSCKLFVRIFSLRAFDSTLILMITLKELIDCCLLSWSSSIVVHAHGRTSTHSGTLLDPRISLYCLSAEEQFDAVLCNPRVPRVGSDFFTFLYDNFIYLNLVYGLTKLSLLKPNIRFIQKVTRWQVT